MPRVLWLLLTLGVVACTNIAGKPLPVVDRNDPTWALAPDQLEEGALPQ